MSSQCLAPIVAERQIWEMDETKDGLGQQRMKTKRDVIDMDMEMTQDNDRFGREKNNKD